MMQVLQIGQVRPQIALYRGGATLGKRLEVVPAGLRHLAPVPRPGLVGAADREGCGAHQARPALQRREPALANGEMEGLGADVDAAVDIEPPTATAEVAVGG